MGTTIKVSETVRERIKEQGKKGETYDEVLKRILDKVEKLDEENKDE